MVRWCAILVIVHSLATAFLWSSRIPFNAAPDEYEHIKTRIFVHLNGRLPHFNETPEFSMHLLSFPDLVPLYAGREGPPGPQRLIASLGMPEKGHFYEIRQAYLFSPQLSHLLAGLLARVAGTDSLDALRCFNHICLALAALATFLSARLLWPGRLSLAVCSGLCVSLWPQLSYIGAYANDDILAVTAAAILILCCTWIETSGFTWSKAIALGLATALVLLSKYHAYPALFVLAYWGAGKTARDWRKVIPLALAAFLALAVVSPWFIRNGYDFDGDIFGMRTAHDARMALANALPPSWYMASNAFNFQNPLFVLQGQGLLNWLRWFGKSYYCAFGWSVSTLPSLFYALPLLAGLGIFAAYLSTMRRQVARFSVALPAAPAAARVRRWLGQIRILLQGVVGLRGRPILLFSVPLLLMCGLMALVNSALVDYQPQGRYALCSFPAIALLAFGALRKVKYGDRIALAILVVQQILGILYLTCYL